MHWMTRSPLWLMVSVIVYNLVQDFLDRSSLMKLHSDTIQTWKHWRCLFVFNFPGRLLCADLETFFNFLKKTLCALVCAAHTFILLLLFKTSSKKRKKKEQPKWPIYNKFTLNMYRTTDNPHEIVRTGER